ncbi:RDD family protein [Rhodospirillaceae bacterium SYSU D60014]|uniref:RDD family protein n=1 Tax=Virgifigura deserti TaxID=2268457 RepID=UPI0013C4AE5B
MANPEFYSGVLWRRVFAYAVDLVLLGVLWVVAFLLMSIAGLLSLGLLFPLIPVGLTLLPIAYHTLLIGGPRSATVGMQLFDLEVRSWTGTLPSYWQALIMTLLFYTTMSLTGFLILLVALFNQRGRTLHDYLSATVVIRRAPSVDLLIEERRA